MFEYKDDEKYVAAEVSIYMLYTYDVAFGLVIGETLRNR